MADVFISYKTERRQAAEHVAEIIRLHGYSVWFDYAGMEAGRDFRPQIRRELHAAKAVVVLWCGLAVGAPWVLEEAKLAAELGSLIPVWLEKVRPPAGHTWLDAVNLVDWDGAPRHPLVDHLLMQIGFKAQKKPQPAFEALAHYDAQWRRFGAPSLRQMRLDAALERRDVPRHTDQPPPPGAPVAHRATVRVELKSNTEVRVGRLGSHASVVINDTQVSGLHASFKLEGSSAWVRDEHSTNGTYLDGKRLDPGVWVRLAGVRVRVHVGPVQLELVAPELRSLPLSVAKLDGSFGQFNVFPGAGEVRIGRDPACGIVLDEPRISGVHASIKLEAGGVFVRDERSNNGTAVDGTRLIAGVWVPARAGATLRFGPLEFRVSVIEFPSLSSLSGVSGHGHSRLGIE